MHLPLPLPCSLASQICYISSAETLMLSLLDLRAAAEAFKAKEQSYQERLENAEIARVKATRAEASGKLNQAHYSNLLIKYASSSSNSGRD